MSGWRTEPTNLTPCSSTERPFHPQPQVGTLISYVLTSMELYPCALSSDRHFLRVIFVYLMMPSAPDFSSATHPHPKLLKGNRHAFPSRACAGFSNAFAMCGLAQVARPAVLIHCVSALF